MPRSTLPFTFGQGVDRASSQVVPPTGRMEVLDNVQLADGSVQPRGGLEVRSTAVDAAYVAGVVAARSAAQAVVVDGYGVPGEASHALRLSRRGGDGRGYTALGDWLTRCYSLERARVTGAESGVRIILAHDERSISRRGDTVVLNLDDNTITPLTAAWANGGNPSNSSNMRFRGVTLHLDRLVGWGFGTNEVDEPNMVRLSNADDPLAFAEDAFFKAGQAGDPVVSCVSISQGESAALLMLKEAETHYVAGSADDNFVGPYLVDRRHGAAATRLVVSDGSTVYVWGLEGPRRFRGIGASEDIGWRLGLNWPTTRDLAAQGVLEQGFAEYLPRRGGGIVVFVFVDYVYALDLRTEEWSHGTLSTPVHCGAVLYARGGYVGASRGYPDFGAATAVDGDSFRIDWANISAEGDETVEVWLRKTGDAWPEDPSYTRSVTQPATVQADGLVLDADYEVAVRFNRGGLFSPGYSGSPESWPSVSRGTFHVPALPPTGEVDAGWARTGASAEELNVTWTNTASSPIRVRRRRYAEGSSAVEEDVSYDLAADTASLHHTNADATHPVVGEKFYLYEVGYVVGETVTPMGQVTVWSGPNGALPVIDMQAQSYINSDQVVADIFYSLGGDLEVFKRQMGNFSFPYDSDVVVTPSASPYHYSSSVSGGVGHTANIAVYLKARQIVNTFGVDDSTPFGPEASESYSFDPRAPV